MVLLLTSSHLSVLISSGIIFLFTLLLFLSGYALQQQTVHNLQHTLHPSATPTVQVLQIYPTSYTADGVRKNATDIDGGGKEEVKDRRLGKAFGSPPGSKGYQDAISISSAGTGAAGAEHAETEAALHPLTPTDTAAEKLEELNRWKGLAYLQLLTSPEDICSSLLFYKTLSKQGSSVPGRVVMYPSTWSTALSSSSSSSSSNTSSEKERIEPGKASALHALKKAKAALGLTLQPVNIPPDSTPAATLLASAFLLPQLKRILYVRSHGMLLNASALDEIMYASKAVEVGVGIAAVGSDEEVRQRALFLLRPSGTVWARLSDEIDKLDDGGLDGVFLGLETMRRVGMPRLRMGDANGVRTLGVGKGEAVGERKDEDAVYVHFSRQELDEGVVMEQRGGLWWDGRARYVKGVEEVCAGLDLGDGVRRKG